MALFLFFDQRFVAWEKLKKVKIRFWGPSSWPFLLEFGCIWMILVSSEVVCKDPLSGMVRKFCGSIWKWFYTNFFLLCLFRVDFLNGNNLHFCVYNFRCWFNMWMSNVRSDEALGWVEVCFYLGGKFSILGGCWLVWSDDVSLLLLLSLSSQVNCVFFVKSFGKFSMFSVIPAEERCPFWCFEQLVVVWWRQDCSLLDFWYVCVDCVGIGIWDGGIVVWHAIERRVCAIKSKISTVREDSWFCGVEYVWEQ